MRLAAMGVAAGLAAALALTRFYGVAPNDPLTLASTAVVLLLVALVPTWIPTRPALRVSPLFALRSD